MEGFKWWRRRGTLEGARDLRVFPGCFTPILLAIFHTRNNISF